MNAKELYGFSIGLLPVVSVKEGFRSAFSATIIQYYKKVVEYGSVDNNGFGKEDLRRLKQLCDGLIKAVRKEFQGSRHSAYAIIRNQLNGFSSKTARICPLANISLYSVSRNSSFFRMRLVNSEERYRLDAEGMFHIPLTNRRCVETQRFSVPGFPCLYMGKSLYGCWEEMRRPDFGSAMASRITSTRTFYLLDLRIPSFKRWLRNKNDSILFFPIIIASMFKVDNQKDSYKPEYIIPQLITEWVISQNNAGSQGLKKKILGIVYTSVHINNDFGFKNEVFENVAIPVNRPLSRNKYCPVLASLFKVTPPTYYELESLRYGNRVDAGVLDFPPQEEAYRISRFGEMEFFLSNIEPVAIKD